MNADLLNQQYSSRLQPSGATPFSQTVANNLSRYGAAGQRLAQMPTSFTPGQFNAVAAQNPALAEQMLGRGGQDFRNGVMGANGWTQQQMNQFINANNGQNAEGFSPAMMALIRNAASSGQAPQIGGNAGQGDLSAGLANAIQQVGSAGATSAGPSGLKMATATGGGGPMGGGTKPPGVEPVGGTTPTAPPMPGQIVGAPSAGPTSVPPGQGSAGGIGGPPATPGPPPPLTVTNPRTPLPAFDPNATLMAQRRAAGYGGPLQPYGGLPGSNTKLQDSLAGQLATLQQSGLFGG